jgi:signal transduction histidine kinase
VLGYLITPVLLAPVMIALYELAVRAPGMWWHWGVVTAVIMVAGLVGAADGYPWPLQLVSSALFLLLPVALAEATRLRRDHLAAVEARAEYAERNREEEARHRVAEERVRMARELHDVVAHHLALANAQAGTAAYLADSRPDQVKRILTELTGTTSAALRELKATVGLLRQPEDTASPLEPVPGLGRLPELTAAFAAAGLAVEVTVDGAERALSPGVDLTAFRIVQEALTNVAKHGTSDTASVHLAYGADRLTVTITNDAEPAVVRPGFGLVGMRERATSAGGRLVAGPGPGDSFTVTTELPILGTP